MVISPAIVVAAALMVPAVSIVALPVIKADAPMVPPLIIGLVRVLLVKVSTPARVATTPLVGKVAVDTTPVPPRPVGNIPVTEALFDRSMAPNDGMPPADGTRKISSGDPALVEKILLSLLPSKTPFAVKLLLPVPPKVTPSIPDPSLLIGSVGMSATSSVVPAFTRPFSSTVTF